MSPRQEIRPLKSSEAFLLRSRPTPRDSVVGGATVVMVVTAAVGLALARRFRVARRG